MRAFLNGLVGFLAILCMLSLFTTWQLAVTLLIFATALYLFFFKPRHSDAGAFLIGVTLGLELLDTHHIGTATLVAVFLYGLVMLLRDLSRFTSEFGRFIVALILFVAIYPCFMLPLGQYVHFIPQLATALLLTGMTTAFIQHGHRHSEYELI